jgi:hypothetical protein
LLSHFMLLSTIFATVNSVIFFYSELRHFCYGAQPFFD